MNNNNKLDHKVKDNRHYYLMNMEMKKNNREDKRRSKI